MRLFCVVLLLGLSSSSLAGVTVQVPGLVVPPAYAPRRDDAEKLFTTSYNAYKQFAFGHDDLSPVSRGFSDGRNGWGASIVDAMPTMLVMGLEDIFEEAVNFSSKIDFSKSQTSDTVSVFETTIRYLGGLLSSYELSDQKFPVLVTKAKEVADKMAFAWVGNNDVPFGHIDFSTNTPQRATESHLFALSCRYPDQILQSNIAEAGTLSLEWLTLSKYTNNATYANLTARSVKHIANLAAPLPGLAAQGIDPTSGNFVGGYVTWGGGSDSYFEYLLKYARLTNNADPIYIDTWKAGSAATSHSLRSTLFPLPHFTPNSYFAQKSTVGNHSYLADFDSSRLIRHVGSHLACFHAGNWLLGGKLLQNQTIIDIALDLNEGCWNTYASTATGIGPEAFAFIGTDGNFTGGSTPSASQLAFYNQHGYYITSSAYILRPEVLESNMQARMAVRRTVTGDTKYLDRAASAIDAFNKFLPATVAFAGLNNVNSVNGGLIDDMESFWFAEVLKYLYLTFDDPSHISLDDYVFNTECQPFKAPPALDSYAGSGKLIPAKPFAVQSGELPAISPNAFSPISLKKVINPQ
ncbi:alpha-1,2-Mannosidase [Mycena venus]|uniref:alpha-1,2-Mannosidase n=1 Tax=Mycena venus TaxID=2733690 RepID=A0A8H7CMJ9_9AGAR|nr:alpha-1,2-Mannosidase [Mycena venus]